MLVAASLSQRDLAEAKPRLNMIPDDDVESARLQWFASLMQPKKRPLNPTISSLLTMDPLTKRNIDLIKRFEENVSVSSLKMRDTPSDRMILLGDAARLRLEGRSGEALNLIERFIKKNNIQKWTHGDVVRSLLHLDEGRVNTATNIAEKLGENRSRHPHLRSLLRHLESIGETISASSEPTGIEWLIDSGLDWVQAWPYRHTVAPAPALVTKELQKHAWSANAWVAHSAESTLEMAISKGKNGWKVLSKYKDERELPSCLFTHLTGVIVTIGGMPVDLGLPGQLNLKAINNAGLLDL
jgi:hypothetical protein